MAAAAGTLLTRGAPPARGHVDAAMLAAVTVVVAAATGTWLAWTANRSTRLRLDLPRPVIAAAAATALLLVAAAVADRRAARGLAVAAFGWLAPLSSAWPVSPALATVLLAMSPLVVPGLAAAVLLPRPRHATFGRRQAIIWVAWLAVAATLAHLMTYDAFGDPSCIRTCADSAPMLGHLMTGRTGAALVAGLTGATRVSALVALLRQPRPALWIRCIAAIAFALPALAAAQQWMSWDDLDTRSHRARDVGVMAAVAVVCAATLVAWWRTRQVRRDLEALVAGLTQLPGGPARAAGSWQEVHFAVPGERRWVDVDGEEVPSARAGTVVLDRDGQPVLRLSVSDIGRPSHEVDMLTPAATLILHNARLAAVVRARSRDVRMS